MNMPKRASCHHCMRRSRSSGVDVVGPGEIALFACAACPPDGKDGRSAAPPANFSQFRREESNKRGMLVDLSDTGAFTEIMSDRYCSGLEVFPLRNDIFVSAEQFLSHTVMEKHVRIPYSVDASMHP